jgi:hypothetical protein
VDEHKTLLLRETGIARLDDGGEAVNVGPIVAALGFLTEGRGEDRGTDEQGVPLPDLLSLAFDVIKSIILGGRQADYFRKVKQDLDVQSGVDGRTSLALAKQAATVRHSTPSTALEKAAADLRARLKRLDTLTLDEHAASALKQSVEAFRDFGADRWVAATSHLLLALNAVDVSKPTPAKRVSTKRTATQGKRAKPKPSKAPAPTRKAPRKKAKASKRR